MDDRITYDMSEVEVHDAEEGGGYGGKSELPGTFLSGVERIRT
jgi:hypothetical protein